MQASHRLVWSGDVMKKNVSIIILNYNDSENTIRFVNEISKYSTLKSIVVVDNNSKKEDYEKVLLLSGGKVTVIQSDKNGGYSYGNNFGINYLEKNKETDYVIISNPDVSVSEESIKKCIDYLQKNENVAIVAPRMIYTNAKARRSAWKKRTALIDIANSTRTTQALLYYFFKSGEYSKNDYMESVLDVDNISGAFFVADFKKFKEIGFFDDNVFLFYEEDIIGNKLKEKGYEICSLNDIEFIHYDSKTIGKFLNLFKKQDILFNSRIYYQKKYNKASFFTLMIFYFLKYYRKLELLIEVPIRKIFFN